MKLKVLLVLCALLLLSAFIAERKAPITIFMIGDSTGITRNLPAGLRSGGTRRRRALRHGRLQSRQRHQPITIFMIGDSTMANKSLKNGNIERGWGQMLPGYFTEEVVVDNHAMNG